LTRSTGEAGLGLDLAQRRNGDPGKVGIARRLRQETTMTLPRIAAQLRMGVWTHVSNLLGARKQSEGDECQ
jgi:hypothetical protein